MFTTVTFDAQEFSIPSNAAIPLIGRAIADAGRHGDHRHSHQSSDDAGQRAFHPGAHNDHACLGQHIAAGQQAMNAGDADVVDMLDVVAHDLRRDHRFLRDGNVAGAGGDDDDLALCRVWICRAST